MRNDTMKMMKNIAAGLTLAFAALSASVTRAGDIYEIVPLGLAGTSQAGQPLYGTDWAGLTPDTALDAGQSFEFIVRLVSPSYMAPTPTNSWDIAYTGVGSDIYADLYYPLQLGLLVSGRLVGAEIYDIDRNAGLNGSMAFTDLYCRYTVKPGDIALPTLFAHDNSGATFFLINDDKWQVRDEYGRVAVFSYCDESTRTAAASKRPVGQFPAMCRTKSLADLNYHVKTIDFDETEDAPGTWWRVVNEAATTTTNAPTVELTGAVATTNAVELFMWAEDETAVRMVGASGGTLETMTIYPTPEATEAAARNVYRFWTVPGKTVYPVAFEGVTEGAGTRLYLSTTTNFVHDAAGTVMTNFLTRAVYCTEPLPPSVKVTLTDNVTVGATLTAKSGALEELGQTDALALKVRLTKPLESGEKATVTLKLSIPGDPAADPFGGNYLSLAQTQDQAFTVRSDTNIVFTAGGPTEKIVYVWPLGGDAATAAGGVLIEPVFDAAETSADVLSQYDTANGVFRLKLNDLKPVIVAPAAADAAVVNDGKVTLDIQIEDCYRDLNAPQEFKVTFLDKTQTVGFRYGQTTRVEFDAPATSGNRTLTVTDPQGNVVSLANIFVNVKRVSAVVQGEAYETTVNEGLGQTLPVTVNLSVPFDGGDLFAFFEPADEAASNLVVCAASQRGVVRIPSGALSNAVPAQVVFDFTDGYNADGSPVTATFDLVLRDGDTTNANVVTAYESTPYVFNIRNVAPVTSAATVDDRPMALAATPEEAQLRSQAVPMGVNIPLVFELDDVSPVDLWATNDAAKTLRVAWKQTDVDADMSNDAALKSEIEYGQPSATKAPANGWNIAEAEVTTNGLLVVKTSLFFSYENTTQMVAVCVQDKDMRAAGDWSGPVRYFKIPVTDQPRVLIERVEADGSVTDMVRDNVTFYEENYRSGQSQKFRVRLSDTPAGASEEKPVTVQLSLVKNGDGAVELSKTNLAFNVRNWKTAKDQEVYFTLLDGGEMSDWELVAEVVGDTTKSDGTLWSDYYAENTAYFTVANLDPVIKSLGGGVKPDSAATNTVPLGTELEIKVTVSDIQADLARGSLPDTDPKAFRVEWIGPGGVGGRVTDIAYGTTSVGLTNTLTATFAYTPQSEGYSEVEINVYDGDGGVAATTVMFYIEPTKRLRVLPIGPVSRATSQSKYGSLTGLGKGRVWAEASRYGVDAFAHTYYAAIRDTELTVFAFGYPAAESAAGYADDGTLGDQNGETGKDYAISQSGSSLAANIALGNYVYGVTGKAFDDEWRYDNFFYCWFEAPSGDEESGTSISEKINGVMRPATKPNVPVSIEAQFDAYEADKQSYGVKRIEAVFSRELYPEDNMGDINGDGIPDLYVMRYGLGVYDVETGEMSGNDVSAVNAWNEDGDALPATDTSIYGALIPGLSDSWLDAEGGSAYGRPFTAKLEIRGFHDGLNDAPAQAGIADVVCDSTTNSFSELELSAARIAGALLPDGNPDITKWSPERPTDPTLEDTDGDGLPDGYEYYIWYQAHVGYMENGVHKFMTGRRYVPERPGEPETITSEEVVSYYDPLVAHPGFARQTSDIDNDGIPDYLEFELGTNPFDFDTDGDGLPDGYEVVMSASGVGDSVGDGTAGILDPLLWATDRTTCDALLNPDADGEGGNVFYRGDTMAVTVQEMNLLRVTLEDGTPAWFCTLENVATTNAGATVTGAVVKVTSGDLKGTYLTSASIAPDVEYLPRTFPATIVWKLAGDAGAYTLGDPTELVKGTPVSVVTNEAEAAVTTLVELPAKYWKAWKYGIDNGFARGIENHAGSNPLEGATFHSVKKEKIQLIHFQVFQELGFDPRTGWRRSPYPQGFVGTNTRNYTHYDEFLSMAFFHYEDTLTAEDMQPTTQSPLPVIWQKYSTNPMSADSDRDGMPDGWELYLMSGVKKYDKDGKRIIDYGPLQTFSPLFPYDRIAGITRDSDDDGLDWPAEYSGIDSSAEYATNTATIVCLDPAWRNKLWPTDPWNEDTDGDGLKDGEENAGAFKYGESGVAGGGLNPLSWDTDKDGLPDPWELEFAGSYSNGVAAVSNTVDGVIGGLLTSAADRAWAAAKITWNRDGVDGTVNDALEDYDGDGLANWQEYLVGAMRCWRYDDTTSTWGMHDFDPEEAQKDWDNYWYSKLVDEQGEDYNPHLVKGMFDIGAYFSCNTNVWESGTVPYGRYYMFRDGVYHALKNPPEKYLGPNGEKYNVWTYKAASSAWQMVGPPFVLLRPPMNPVYPVKYICCDPRLADTDRDGMDDRYELFHGLNPLLGVSDRDKGDVDAPYDVIYAAYGGEDGSLPEDAVYWSAENNYWLNAVELHRDVRVKDPAKSLDDFFAFPWLTGRASADPDGDNIRNQQEAIMPGLQASSTYLNTDPTPLWMTDTGYVDSFTRRYYLAGETAFDELMSGNGGVFRGPDGTEYRFTDFPGFAYNAMFDILSHSYELETFWGVSKWLFSFEENEGYDSDHDWTSDFEESQARMSPASDPQRADSPLRRQAMWFNGTDAFLQTALPISERPISSYLAGEPRRNFLYYTVECWAMPDAAALAKNGLQTLVERVILTDTSNAADENFIRKNFLLGLRNGRWYTRFDTTGTDAKQSVEIDAGTSATNGWTHLAAAYDGLTLKLYVNGKCVNTLNTSLQPEHGVAAASVDGAGVLSDGSLRYDTISMLVGASAVTGKGIMFDSKWRGGEKDTTLADYGNFFHGYIDEVRIWDGARSAAEILADFENRVRYTSELAGENRQLVFAQWAEGATRAPGSPIVMSPALKYHWSFDQLPGAVNPADVLKTPAGFSTAAGVTDSRAVWSRPEGWTNAWWHSVAVRSTVYTDTAWVPWIADTVGHLPRFDLTTASSVYWSEDLAGYTPAAEHGFSAFRFPRAGEVWSKWVQQTYEDHKLIVGGSEVYYIYLPVTRYKALDALKDESLLDVYRFALRDRQREGFDLLPMGGAYPRRISAAEGGMWDSGEASDAWTQTGNDADNNGLPDWWEDWARNNYCTDLPPSEPLDRDTIVDYHGQSLTAWEAYLRDLAAGMIKDGENVTVDPDYASTVDTDGDGLPDWWEDATKALDKTDPSDAGSDVDYDGLSAYHEYVLSEKLPKLPGLAALNLNVPILSPERAFSAAGQTVPDYFLCYTNAAVNVTSADGRTHFSLNQYFGSIVTDHDFMEDWWENLYPNSYTSASVYDPLDDRDEDGWSTWAECRASLWAGYFSADLIDRWTGSTSEQFVPCRPQPVIGVRATYHGVRDVTSAPLVIRTTSGQTPRVDATFVVPSEVDAQTKYLGSFTGDTEMNGHLSPGHVNANSIVFERALMASDKTYHWNWNWYEENNIEIASSSNLPNSGDFETYRYWYSRYPHIQLEGAELDWEAFTTVVASTDEMTATLSIMGSPTAFGTVDCRTGEYTLDMTKFTGASSYKDYVFRVTYTSRIGSEWPQTVYVSDTKEFATGDYAGQRGSGFVREGRNLIEAFFDLDGNGAYDPGEPYGFAPNVDVGWHRTGVTVIELTDTAHAMARVNVVSGADDRGVVSGSEGAAAGSGAAGEGGDAGAESAGGLTKEVLVRRTNINGITDASSDGVLRRMPQRTILTKACVLDDRAYLTEADILSNKRFDLDAKWLVRDAAGFGILRRDIQSAGYDVIEKRTLSDGTVSNVVIKSFVNTFNTARGMATALAPIDAAPVYSAAPTFAFSSDDRTMTAYRLQVRAKGGELMYDSGIALLPGRVGRTAGGSAWEVTPALYADDIVTSGSTTNAPFFADGAAYEWRVALYNAKFSGIEAGEQAWSAWASFEMDLANTGRNPVVPTGYANTTVAVRYFGPSVTNDLAGKVVVEAFASADFSGQPLARVRLADTSKLNSRGDIEAVDAVLRGIAPGRTFLRAYIDFNGNGRRDDWEAWGYANRVGENFSAIYNPKALALTASAADWVVPAKADVMIYMEDCDVNRNEIPDGLEPENFPPETGEDDDDSATWEEWAEVDLEIDAEYAAPGDVMAYREEPGLLVVLWDGTDETTVGERQYLYRGKPADLSVTVDAKSAGHFARTYDYNGKNGLGSPVPAAEVLGLRVYQKRQVTVALVHAQVYDAVEGFNPLTAVVADGAVDTKPFTVMDKKLLVRYLENTGRTPANPNPGKYATYEEYLMTEGNAALWSKYTLRPDLLDADRDGIADGWELYVMAGPSGAFSASTGLSPWAFADHDGDPDGDGLVNLAEYNGGTFTSDPWDAFTRDLGDGTINDRTVAEYSLYTAATQLADDDNDGLSNWAEYLATQAGYGTFRIDDACSVVSNRLDYFTLVTDAAGNRLYVAEALDKAGTHKIADHDFIEDGWEDLYGVKFASRYVYDAFRDGDADGWSNYAEYMAGSFDPSRVAVLSIENSTLPEYPQPMIIAKTPYSGSISSNSQVYIQAFTGDLAKAPDATWKMSTASDTAEGSTNRNTKIIGSWMNGAKRFMLSPSSIQPGTVLISAKDIGFKYYESEWNDDEFYYGYYYDYYGVDYMETRWNQGSATEAEWVEVIHDVMRENDSLMGDLVYTGAGESVVVGWINYENGQAEIDLSLVTGYVRTSEKRVTSTESESGGTTIWYDSYYYITRLSMENSYFKVVYASQFVSQGANQKFFLSEAAVGYLREGRNTFVAFADIDGDGTYTMGEPFGCVRDVMVGWDKVPNVEIQLRDDSVSLPRFTVESTNAAERVRIYRTAINGKPVDRRLVWVKNCDLTTRNWLSEMDYIPSGSFDFDCTYLVADAGKAGIDADDIFSATYEIYAGAPVTPILTHTRTFSTSRVLPVASGTYANADGKVLAAQPELSWKGAEDVTAFRIQIAADEGFSDVVYDSGVRHLPALHETGYTFRPEAYVGAGLKDDTTYFWRVAEYNAKFTAADETAGWSAVASFTTAVDSSNANTGYGKLAAEVRYFGAATDALTNVVVGVYESADFMSMPVAKKRLAGDGTVASLTNDLSAAFTEVATNVVFDGIAPGEYYVMAFIDTNENGVRDAYEPWGYVCNVATGSRALWQPAALTVVSTKTAPEKAFLVMEDTDVNQNMTPDCLEDMSAWTADPNVDPGDDSQKDSDGDGLSNGDEDFYGTDPYETDTDGDGIPDGYEVATGTDPLAGDADFAGIGDVMAYKTDTVKILAVTNDRVEIVTNWVTDICSPTNIAVVATNNVPGPQFYAVASWSNRTASVENGVWTNALYTTFEVDDRLYVGAPVKNPAAIIDDYDYGFMTNVIVMHSAVYDFFGYDPTTARAPRGEGTNAVAGVNTAPFTAYLKYVTQKFYLAEFGDATEDFSLAVGKLDSNANFLPDGWELYVRYAADQDFSETEFRVAYERNYDPYNDYYLWQKLFAEQPSVGGALAPYTNGEAIERGWLEPEWDWNYSPADDVMALASVKMKLAVSNGTAYAVMPVMDEEFGDIVVATNLYETFTLSNGTVVVGRKCDAKVTVDEFWATVSTNVVLIHSAVYDYFGFDPTTALPAKADGTNTVAGANTVPFTAAWKQVTEKLYLKGLFDVDWTFNAEAVDSNANGLPDGWELYVAFATATVDPNTNADFPLTGKALDYALESFDENAVLSDPWNKHYFYNLLASTNGVVKYTDTEARRFRLTDGNLTKDEDFDALANYKEFLAWKELGIELDVRQSKTDGTVFDYFRAKSGTYTGLEYNGGEFIDSDLRTVLGMTAMSLAGTRDYAKSGWDYWSTASYSIAASEGVASVSGVSEELMLVIRYLNVIRPGEFQGGTLDEVLEFFHANWEGITRAIDEDGNVLVEAKDASVMGGAYIADADAVTTTEGLIRFFGGVKRMQADIVANRPNLNVVQPEVDLSVLFKYAGSDVKTIVVEAYQVNAAYPERGEQRTAVWNVTAQFSDGLAEAELSTPTTGRLVQGPARFIAYIDANGDTRYTPGETSGTVVKTVGYAGLDVEIQLAESNPSLPVIPLARTSGGEGAEDAEDASASNSVDTVQTVALVRTKVNGVRLEKPRGVVLRHYQNNLNRDALYPVEYLVSGDFVGVDRYLEQDIADGELQGPIESVTYEIIRKQATFDAATSTGSRAITLADLNYYVVTTEEGGSNVTQTVERGVNEEFTLVYGDRRDISRAVSIDPSALDGSATLTFQVPDDGYANTRYWIEWVDLADPATTNLIGGTSGALLASIVDGRVFVDLPLPNGSYKVRVALGNDKFGKPAGDADWSEWAEFAVADAPVRAGKIAVTVKHPLDAVSDKITVAVYETVDLVNPIKVLTDQTVNAPVVVDGLRENGIYYVAAWYVKDAEDGRPDATERKPWDTWGYATKLGLVGYAFDALAIEATADGAEATVYLQDTDWNDNGIEDRTESIKSVAGLTEALSPLLPTDLPFGDIDGDGDGVPDDVDPDDIFDNSGDALPGDVMAYAFKRYTVVALGTADEAETSWTWYAIGDMALETNDLTKTIAVGTPAETLNSLRVVYTYGYLPGAPLGIGRGVSFEAADQLRVKAVKTAELLLVHAQVYDAFGFNPNTANGAIDASEWVNTRPFTAYDKSVLAYYLHAIGAIETLDKPAILEFLLDTSRADTDQDGVIDGWELYVMCGPAGAGPVFTHSPWTYEDRARDVDNDGLELWREYDAGNIPTDPWNGDTDGNGVGDLKTFEYFLKNGPLKDGQGVRGDMDNDQLSNFMEFMISSLDGFPTLNAERMATNAEKFGGDQLVPDYFLRHGSLYLGEMFTDHDFIEDWLEDSDVLFDADNRSSRFIYDATSDDDDDGWDNWSEARAFIAAGTKTVYEVVTNGTTVVSNATEVPLYTGKPQPTGRIKVVYNGDRAWVGNVVVQSYRYRDGAVPPMTVLPDCTWTLPVADRSAFYELAATTNGFVAGGRNMFVVFNDADADGRWTAGESYGIVPEVEVGYASGITDSTVELTDCNSSMMRIDLANALAATDFAAQNALTDRGVNGFERYPNSVLTNSLTFAGSLTAPVRVRLVRTAIDGVSTYYNSSKRVTFDAYDVLVDETINLSTLPSLTEWMMLKQNAFDLDWSSIRTVANTLGILITEITDATYAIVIGDGEFNTTAFNGENALSVCFNNAFEAGAAQSLAVPTGLASAATDNRPVFTWTHANTIGKDYPAFQLRVYKKSGNALVYDSGVQRAPAKNSQGVYSWAAPIYVGAELESGVGYYYTVSMLDAKFTTPNDGETKYEFAFNVNSAAGAIADYGLIPVAVKYMGPGDTTKAIRVEAFDSPDFAGAPVSVTFVENVDTIAADDTVALNAIVEALPLGREYYLRAFIDTNSNGRRDAWESWGYGNYVGMDRKDVYTPRAYALAAKDVNDGTVPECVIYIEDADVNDNKIPDVWEWDKDGKLGGTHTTGAAAASPWIVTIPATNDTFESVNLFVKLDASAIGLPYYSALTQMQNGGSLPSVSIALAMAGIDLTKLDLKPAVTITSFSLTDGITLDVDPKAEIDGQTLKPEVINVSVTLKLTLQFTTSLTGTWENAAETVKTFSLTSGSTTIPAADLNDMNAVIKDGVNAKGTAGFYRVLVEVPSAVAQ